MLNILNHLARPHEILKMYQAGERGAVFDLNNPESYSETPNLGEVFPGARSLVGEAQLRTSDELPVRIGIEHGKLCVAQPLGTTGRHPLYSETPLLASPPCTLAFSLLMDPASAGPRTMGFWQHEKGAPGRVQITINSRYTKAGHVEDLDKLQVFIHGASGGQGRAGQPRQAEAPRGQPLTVVVVLREESQASELWVGGHLIDTFSAPAQIAQVPSYLMGYDSMDEDPDGLCYGRFLSIDRALTPQEVATAGDWVAKAFNASWHGQPLYNRDLLNAAAAVSYLVPSSGIPEPQGQYQSIKTLYAKNLDDVQRPASMTKVLTAMVMLDNVDDLQDTVEVQDTDATKGSGNNLRAGDILSYEDLLYNMMLPSSNVSTTVVARTIGTKLLAGSEGEPMARFIEEMNTKARTLGMHDSHFLTASGLNRRGMVTTVRDMARMGISALAYPALVKVWRAPRHIMNIQGPNPDIASGWQEAS